MPAAPSRTIAAVRSLDDQLARRETEERTALEAEFGHNDDDETDDSPALLPLSIAMARRGGRGEAPSLPPEAYTLLNREFGLRDFRPNQVQVIGNVLAGQSTLAIMPTGAGKSLTYQLPAMLLPQGDARRQPADRPDEGPDRRPAGGVA